ncbi:hypothetical protein KSP39_PZI020095 [Platanthera zijinensis]|uniref:Uncharacterized protein n=1 Tax=Platanthera zijinensis TaxID=2320716 RepID=A0AAP0B018_9ASPA
MKETVTQPLDVLGFLKAQKSLSMTFIHKICDGEVIEVFISYHFWERGDPRQRRVRVSSFGSSGDLAAAATPAVKESIRLRFLHLEEGSGFLGRTAAAALEEKRARLGLVECVNHDLLQPYPVLHEKPGKYHCLCLILLLKQRHGASPEIDPGHRLIFCEIDTKNILFICCGAFVDLEKTISERQHIFIMDTCRSHLEYVAYAEERGQTF